jgi:hypothetical protein
MAQINKCAQHGWSGDFAAILGPLHGPFEIVLPKIESITQPIVIILAFSHIAFAGNNFVSYFGVATVKSDDDIPALGVH